eukprot:g22793.t1
MQASFAGDEMNQHKSVLWSGVTKILNKKYVMSLTLHTAPTTDCAFEASLFGHMCKRCQKHRNRHVNFESVASDMRALDFASRGGLKATTSSRINCSKSTTAEALKVDADGKSKAMKVSGQGGWKLYNRWTVREGADINYENQEACTAFFVTVTAGNVHVEVARLLHW